MIQFDPDEATIHLAGRLDAADRAALLEAARALLAQGRGGTVDASALSAWDLATFQIVLALRRDVSAVGETVRLVGEDAPSFKALAPLGLSAALADSLRWEVW